MALLQLPEKFGQVELYTTIAGLSYGGDFRMVFGENPDKVRNIVTPNLARFDKLYRPLLEVHPDFAESLALSCPPNAAAATPWTCSQDLSPATLRHHLQHLPAAIRPPIRPGDAPERAAEAAAENLRALVARSSVRQSAKGIATAGVMKSSRYVAAKVGKFVMGWGRRIAGR